MTDPLTQWLDEMDAKARAATPGPWEAHDLGPTLVERPERKPIAVDNWSDAAYIAALPPETVEALLECVRAAALASDEIQSQHTMWPGEVDTLHDALARLRALAGREG